MLQDAVRNSRGSLSAWKMPAEFYENKDMNTEGKLIILQKKKKSSNLSCSYVSWRTAGHVWKISVNNQVSHRSPWCKLKERSTSCFSNLTEKPKSFLRDLFFKISQSKTTLQTFSNSRRSTWRNFRSIKVRNSPSLLVLCSGCSSWYLRLCVFRFPQSQDAPPASWLLRRSPPADCSQLTCEKLSLSLSLPPQWRTDEDWRGWRR